MFSAIAAGIGAVCAIVGAGVGIAGAVKQSEAMDAAEEAQKQQLAKADAASAKQRARELRMAKNTASAGSLAMANSIANERRNPAGSLGFKRAHTPWISTASGNGPAVANRSHGAPWRSTAARTA